MDKTKSIITLIVLMIAFQIAAAQPGQIDSSFSNNGILWDPPFLGEMITQPDGKIIFNGVDHLTRYHDIGIIDSSFGLNGIASINSGDSTDMTINLVIVQPGQKLLLVGVMAATSFSPASYAMARMLPNGNLDKSLNGVGKQKLNVLRDSGQVNSVAMQKDGKIVLVGSRHAAIFDSTLGYTIQVNTAIIYRVNGDGKPDIGFGINGFINTSSPLSTVANDVLIQDDGKIVVAGFTSKVDWRYYIIDSMHIERYLSDGSLDTTFNGDGKISWSPKLESGATAHKLLLQPDGKIIVGGIVYNNQSHGRWTGGYFTLWRYNTNGRLDSSFNKNGFYTVYYGFTSNHNVVKIALQTDGKILTVGSAGYDVDLPPTLALVRVKGNGDLDNGFADGGRFSFPPLNDPSGESIGYLNTYSAIIKNGRIYVAGEISYQRYALVAIKNDGIPFKTLYKSLCPQSASTIIQSDLTGGSYQWQVSTDSINYSNINNNANYSGVNSASLGLQNIPISWQNYRYRCLAGTSVSNTTLIYFLNENENEWTGKASNDWENPANWLCGAVPGNNTRGIVNGGNVMIHSNVTVTGLQIQPGASVTVGNGYTLTVLKQAVMQKKGNN